MKIKLLVTISLGVILAIGLVTPASAYYAGYFQTSSYGAKATIRTSYSQPTLAPGESISSWVSTERTPDWKWVQTGWGYPVGGDYSAAYSYWEYSAQFYDQIKLNAQAWGSTKIYRVSWSNPYWYAFIDGTWIGGMSGGGLPSPPYALQALSEVNGTPVLQSRHSDVQSMRSDYTWYSFDQWWNYDRDLPYNVDYFSPANFNTWGP